MLRLSDVDEPTVGDDQVLVRVQAASVNSGDTAVVRGMPYLVRAAHGLRRPRARVIGQDFAGRVEAVGSKVSRFEVGDEAFGGGHATFAELAVAPEKRITPKPAGVSFEEAAAPSRCVTTLFSSQRARLHTQKWSVDDLTELARMVEAGDLTPVIERTYPLAEAVSYVAAGHARGKVVITV